MKSICCVLRYQRELCLHEGLIYLNQKRYEEKIANAISDDDGISALEELLSTDPSLADLFGSMEAGGLDEQHIKGSATSAFMRTKLGFVSDEDVRDFFERPLFQLTVTALPASSGCAASISARVIAPIEGARFVYDKKPLQKPTFVTIWEDMNGEGGRAIYEPHEQITARIEATIDTLINEFAEAWTHSQGIGHPKYGAP